MHALIRILRGTSGAYEKRFSVGSFSLERGLHILYYTIHTDYEFPFIHQDAVDLMSAKEKDIAVRNKILKKVRLQLHSIVRYEMNINDYFLKAFFS